MAALWPAKPGWVVAGVALEGLSMTGFVLLQHRLLKAAGAKVAFTSLLATDYASNAIALGVPVVGSGIAVATALRRLRQRGIDPAAIRLTLSLAGVISTVGFAIIAATGAVLVGNPVGAGTGLLTGCVSAAVVTLLVIAAHSPDGRARLQPVATSALRLAQRIVALAAAGLGSSRAVGAVLLYRIISFKIAVPAWVLYLHLRPGPSVPAPPRPDPPVG